MTESILPLSSKDNLINKLVHTRNGFLIGRSDTYIHTHIHTYILKHEAGENYSLYYKTVLELIFEKALQKIINILTSNNTTLVFEFENKP
ncbi:MAG TPA: hypothetical protein VE619_06740 [Nitrososphaeraceae archaeon]|nr:hypothetical protein [Nitrososphaeraceae archaeon]